LMNSIILLNDIIPGHFNIKNIRHQTIITIDKHTCSFECRSCTSVPVWQVENGGPVRGWGPWCIG
jgi:hypothetical protein